jgi:hypothetical protein
LKRIRGTGFSQGQLGIEEQAMELSPRAVRFVIEALEHYQDCRNQELKNENLSDDDSSDLANDLQYLEEIKAEFKRYHDKLTKGRSRARADV